MLKALRREWERDWEWAQVWVDEVGLVGPCKWGEVGERQGKGLGVEKLILPHHDAR